MKVNHRNPISKFFEIHRLIPFFIRKEMRKRFRLSLMILLCLFLLTASLPLPYWPSSYPYLTPETVRAQCDSIFREDTLQLTKPIEEGDIVFVQTNLLPQFFKNVHPTVDCRYALITHNHDNPSPGPFAPYLDDSHLVAWYTSNWDGYAHPKLHGMPFGIVNKRYPYGDVKILEEVKRIAPSKSTLLYMNFTLSNDDERRRVYKLFSKKSYCKNQVRTSGRVKALDQKTYQLELAKAKFVLSPRGYGQDCYRTWEAIHFGAIPVVKSSSLDPIFEDLPVLIVEEWEEITPELLEKTWEEAQKKSYRLEKLYAPYWFQRIKNSF